MKLLKRPNSHILRDFLLFFASALFAMPGVEIGGISASYIPCCIALIMTPNLLSRIPRVILILFSLASISFVFEIFKPTSLSFMGSRYRSIANQINSKFATSIESENLILWMKFSLALIGGIVLVIYAYSCAAESVIVRGFLTGSVISVLVGFLTLKPGEGDFLQSIGLGRTTTTFGMLCTYSIALVFMRPHSSKFKVIMISLLMGGSLISGSRGAAITSFLSIFFILILQRSKSRILLMSWALMIVTLTILENGQGFLSRYDIRAIKPNTSVTNSNLIRKQLYQQSFIDWTYDPLGGVGFSVLTQGHSAYLQTLAAGGLLFFLGYLMTDLRALISVISVQRFANQEYLLALAFCLIFNHITQNQIDIPFLYLVVGIMLIEPRKVLLGSKVD